MNFIISLYLCFIVSLITLTNSFVCKNLICRSMQSKLYDSSTENDATKPVPTTKGFGAVKPKTVEEAPKDAGTLTYESQAKRGVPEYNIFLRPSNGTEVEWVPVGSMTIPRDKAPSDAIFEVEKELLAGSFKLYPKLKVFYEIRDDKSGIFEYGYCMKAFPDEPIKIAVPTKSKESNFFMNWIGKITNPIDNSDLKNKGTFTMKQ